ncbi:MAG: 3, phiSA1p26 [Gemmatimonadales bacterium]|nr:3, phiSA1p26 [Gemmatimonadales bacterium]
MHPLTQLCAKAHSLLVSAIERYQPKHIVSLFSGGHDSLVATHLASEAYKLDFACHIDTGFGIPATHDYVTAVCAELEIRLRCYSAPTYRAPDGILKPQLYRDLVLEHGFPGPPMHTMMYQRLKERPLRQMIRGLSRARTDRVLLVSGIRASESQRRGRRNSAIQVWEGTKVWVAPLWDFSKFDVNAYIEHYNIPRNPVVDALHKSGECLCGAFAKPGEKEEIRFWYPDVAARIDRLEEEVQARGFEWGWGQKRPKERRSRGSIPEAALCASCSLLKQDGGSP